MKPKRQAIYNKFGGKCAYSGSPLNDDWQIDHAIPMRRCIFGHATLQEVNDPSNLLPAQWEVNFYKGGGGIESLRSSLSTLHIRLAKLPKNPRSPNGIRRKAFLLRLAGHFGITPEKPFYGKFYFETL